MTKCIEQDARQKKPTLVYSREIKISSAMCKLCTHWTELPVCMSPRDTSVLRRYNNALWSTRIYFPFFLFVVVFVVDILSSFIFRISPNYFGKKSLSWIFFSPIKGKYRKLYDDVTRRTLKSILFCFGFSFFLEILLFSFYFSLQCIDTKRKK